MTLSQDVDLKMKMQCEIQLDWIVLTIHVMREQGLQEHDGSCQGDVCMHGKFIRHLVREDLTCS
jgi:hypothetical protein